MASHIYRYFLNTIGSLVHIIRTSTHRTLGSPLHSNGTFCYSCLFIQFTNGYLLIHFYLFDNQKFIQFGFILTTNGFLFAKKYKLLPKHFFCFLHDCFMILTSNLYTALTDNFLTQCFSIIHLHAHSTFYIFCCSFCDIHTLKIQCVILHKIPLYMQPYVLLRLHILILAFLYLITAI